MVARVEHHQVTAYLAAIAAGAVLGLAAPAAGAALEPTINPVLAALLYTTFLQVPAAQLVAAARDGRFLAAALVINFAVAPLVVAAMWPLLPADRAVRLGVLLVLLTPCVDYVIVFSGLAGARSRQLLAATPLLLLAQMALLPGFLLLFLGPGLGDVVEPRPFVRAFLVLIVLPLALAWATQSWARRHRSGRITAAAAGSAMVPLMAATLLVVVASQVAGLGTGAVAALRVLPFYVAFLVLMPLLGVLVARSLRLDVPAGRAIVFTGATRNSLVVLPLALALPDALSVAAVVVVAQTLVEVLGMALYVRLVPRLLPD
nr:bile acid:sodium symporter [Saccharopolyspora sp. HNM0983]